VFADPDLVGRLDTELLSELPVTVRLCFEVRDEFVRFVESEEDTALDRTLVGVHPLVWIGAKLVVGGAAAVIFRLGAHRDFVTACVAWFVALPGFVGPLGWLELLF
jgi:hypothetical protein